jgi:aspartyl-tRNA(Asn)/glutamyl-tRNA(Gln) amidotransferase subunit A
MESSDPAAWTLVQAVSAVREGVISSEVLTRLCLARIDALQPALNAFIAVDRDGAIAAARTADARRAAGAPCGPLHGAPLAHKDMFYRAGGVTAGGSKIWADRRNAETATVLQRLDASGALDLGRLNMAEFAMGPTGHNAHYGRVRNPVRPDLITGGSSSGSAAAVRSGMVFGALGSDTGGSIRLPAAICGAAGLKPGLGRVSVANVMPLSVSMDCIGPIARTVADVAALFAVIADPAPSNAPASPPWASSAAGEARPLAGCTVGVPDAFHGDDLDGEVAAALDSSRAILASLGARVVAVTAPDIDLLGELAGVVSMVEASEEHRERLGARAADYGPQVRARLLNGLAMSRDDYRRALQERPRLQAVMAEAFAHCDVIHMPVLAIPPPSADTVDVEGGPELQAMVGALTRYTRPISYLGLPALAQPVGSTRSGLPLSMQLVGPPMGEAALLAIGQAYERQGAAPAAAAR